MTTYRVTVTTELDTGNGDTPLGMAERLKALIVKTAIWERLAFADKLRVMVEKVEGDE